MMAGRTIAQRQEDIRNVILRALEQEGEMTARQMSYELAVFDVWLTPDKIASLMRSDPVLRDAVTSEYVNRRGWAGLVYTPVGSPDQIP